MNSNTSPTAAGASGPAAGNGRRRGWRLTEVGVTRAAAGFGAVSALVALVTLPRPYWFDEAQTIWYLRQSLPRMLQLVANDFVPPLYHLMMFFWVRLAGYGEIITALPSVVFAAVSVWLTYLLGRQIGGSRIGRWAALLYGPTYAVLWYAQETRMYTLLAALGVGLTIVFLRLLTRQRSSDWRWYFFVALAGMYTHYAFWFLVFAQNIIALWLMRAAQPPFDIRRWVRTQLFLVAGALPLVPVIADRVRYWYLATETVLDLYPTELPWGPLRNVLGMLFTPLAYGNQFGRFTPGVALGLAALVAAALVPLVVASRFRERTWQLTFRLTGPRLALGVLAGSIVVPLAVLTVLDVSFMRYIIFVVPLLCCLMAMGLAAIPSPRVQRWLLLLLVGGAALVNGYFLAIYVRLFPPHEYLDHWPNVAEYIERREQPGREMILFIIQDHEAIFRHYYRGQLPVVGFLPADRVETGDYAVDRVRWISRPGVTAANAASVARVIQGYEAIWLPGPDVKFLFDIGAYAWQWFEAHCRRTDTVVFRLQSPLNLYRYDRCAAPAPRGLPDAA